MSKKAFLIVLDGWGIASDKKVSAIDQADTPFMDHLWQNYPHSELSTSGLDVGLPAGQMGNSEVGHLNLGAGRVVFQNIVKINKSIEEKYFFENKVLLNAFEYAKHNQSNVHFMGLASDGGIHSHINHLFALIDMAQRQGISKSFVHAFTDGRDTDPKSGISFIQAIESFCQDKDCQLASVIGRYYAMDRDKRWERVKLAYDALCHGKGVLSSNLRQAITTCYSKGETDEFIKPILKTNDRGEPLTTIRPDDVVIFFNFRTDRGRQLTDVLTQRMIPDHKMNPLPLHFVTMTNYDDQFKNIHVVFEDRNISNSLGEVISKAGKTQVRIAETEKYPHVTFFFSGGREEPFFGEERIMCDSPKAPTYDLKPEMSAVEIKNAIIPHISEQQPDFILLNFANPDMVGHTGDFNAAIKACETVDHCLQEVIHHALSFDYQIIVLADHGNADYMINPDGSPNTAHTTNPVPCILVSKDAKWTIKNGNLSQIAPTILALMGINKPGEMTSESILNPMQ